MSRRGLKITGFARFMLVLIVAAPVAFLGASYINGEDGIAKLKDLLGIEQAADQTEKPTRSLEEPNRPAEPATPTLPEQGSREEAKLKEDLEYYQRRVEELRQENERLKQQLWEKEQELARLQEADATTNN
ncbi:MAG: hypothetical protein KDC30_10975 [Saprospiraceae bacterium]|nr:hypothetical protein [Saprospiraceae bacterium]